MTNRLASLFLIITLGIAQGANAGPFEDGEAAWSRGDYATALSMWRPLAAQGNAMAQNNLGVMYAKRLGRRVFCLTSGLPPTRAGRMQKPLLAGGATEPMMSQRWL